MAPALRRPRSYSETAPLDEKKVNKFKMCAIEICIQLVQLVRDGIRVGKRFS